MHAVHTIHSAHTIQMLVFAKPLLENHISSMHVVPTIQTE
jgi:hypothetical protein